MTGWTCVRTAQLIISRAAGLSEADRLRLEEHLQECATCRNDARALDALVDLAGTADENQLSDRVLGRLVTTVLRGNADSIPPPVARAPARNAWYFVTGMGLAAAAMVLWMAAQHNDGKPKGGQRPVLAVSTGDAATPPPLPAPAPAPVVLDGKLVAGDLASASASFAVGDALPGGVTAHSARGARLELAHALIVLSPGGELAWRPEESTARLYTGTLMVTVDPRPHRSFRAETARFTIEAVGGRFELSAGGVRVFEGVVRVRAASGAVLVDALNAGGRWQLAD